MSRLADRSGSAPRRKVGVHNSWLLILVLGGYWTSPLCADDPAPPKPLTSQQQERLKERNRYLKQSNTLRRQGQLAEAQAEAEKMVAIEREVLGPIHAEVAESLKMIAQIQQERADFAGSGTALKERLELMVRLHGADHWMVTDARQDLADNERLARLPALDRKRLEEGNQLGLQSVTLYEAGKFSEALVPAQQAAAIRKALLGEFHPDYATSLNNLAAFYRAQGNPAKAEPLYRQALEIRGKVLGENHPDYATSLNNLAILYKSQEDPARAAPLFRAALEIRKKVLGENGSGYADSADGLLESLEAISNSLQARADFAASCTALRERVELLVRLHGADHWKVTDARQDLADNELLARLSAADRDRLEEGNQLSRQSAILYGQGNIPEALVPAQQAAAIRKTLLGETHRYYATSLNDIALMYKDRGDYAHAEQFARESLGIRKNTQGENHPDYATSMSTLGWIYQEQGKYSLAEPLHLAAREILKTSLGENHPSYALSLNNLAVLYKSQGRYAQAEPLFRQALEIRKEVLGEDHPHYAISLNNLAALYQEKGEDARAELLYRHAMEIWKKTLGESHPVYAHSLNNLAVLYQDHGDYAEAEPLFRKALEIREKALSENHPDHATSLNNLAMLYEAWGDYERAEPLLRRTLEIRKNVVGENHPDYALSLNNLAAMYQHKGDDAQAEPLLLQVLEIHRKAQTEAHPDYALSLSNLAMLYMSRGDNAQAEAICQAALAIRKKTLGENHPIYAQNLNNLALLYARQGDLDRARPLANQAITIALQHLENSAAAQSERQQFAYAAALRRYLDNYLAIDSAQGSPALGAYTRVLSWKGAVTARQRLARAARLARSGNNDPEVLHLCDDLETVSRQLARLSRTAPDPRELADFPTRLQELSERRERLEADLSQRTEAFRRLRASRGLTPADLQQLLPEDTALVDFLEYGSPKEKKEGHAQLGAFVVRRQGITRVNLGEVAPLAEAIARFRGTLNRTRPVTGPNDPAVLLRQRLWKPLEETLAGARLVLLSPDGALNGLPFAALPGREDGTYLLEDLALAVLPVPQLLPELLAKRDPAKSDTPPSLLALGDVDFDADLYNAQPAAAEPESAAGWHRRRAGESRQWTRLEGTRGEVLSIADTFRAAVPQGKLDMLREGKATAAALRRQAPEFDYLHLATHGYFADPSMKAATVARESRGGGPTEGVIGHDPGLLSGLVFAGANHPTDEDDGVLTALEVSELELSRVELAVLSACETGLGEVAGGEGVLGLQRAFQVAGARTLVTSLWKVDDQATRQLMERFYESYWKKGLGAQEALREAQLWLLRVGVKRGFGREDEDGKANPRTPPLYWAAFVLSGDWR